MDGVASKVAQEVCVLFENDDVDALAGKQVAEHQPCRAAARNADLAGERFHARLHASRNSIGASPGDRRQGCYPAFDEFSEIRLPPRPVVVGKFGEVQIL
jgi:hypothetical protein